MYLMCLDFLYFRDLHRNEISAASLSLRHLSRRSFFDFARCLQGGQKQVGVKVYYHRVFFSSTQLLTSVV